ncbi:hypothetical protein LWI29_030441 [Acer saccharum]|uniref:Uncharacterized protein n=1 Tax=Acer saccharum TaxID=4024 RepID=A0AA39RJQ4_ACESA|nr:hypothetical protein LWI29_030441 [Acer saccharum]
MAIQECFLFLFCIFLALLARSDAVKPMHYSMPFNRSLFPAGFTFGAGSAAYQSEGAASIDGRGPSIWDTFTKNHPEGKLSGGMNPLGVKFYNNVINELLANGMTPFVTLFHWDLPQALEDEYGGFLSSKIVKDFQDYSDFCFKTFGDRVKHWATMNEPYSYSNNGYNGGTFAPGRCSSYMGNCTSGDSSTEPYIVAHNLLLSHAVAVKIYKTKYQVQDRCGHCFRGAGSISDKSIEGDLGQEVVFRDLRVKSPSEEKLKDKVVIEGPMSEISSDVKCSDPVGVKAILSHPTGLFQVDRTELISGSEGGFWFESLACKAGFMVRGLTVISPGVSKKRRGRKSSVSMKGHNMILRSFRACEKMKHRNPELINKVAWNLEDEVVKVLEKGMAPGFNFYGKKTGIVRGYL